MLMVSDGLGALSRRLLLPCQPPMRDSVSFEVSVPVLSDSVSSLSSSNLRADCAPAALEGSAEAIFP